MAHVWPETRCGDGVCDAPWEFAAFGPSLGCRMDCGEVAREALRAVTVTLQADFTRSPLGPAAALTVGNNNWVGK